MFGYFEPLHTEFLIINSKIFYIMKKIILLIFIAAAIAFSSCDDGKPHCWQVTVQYKAEGISKKYIVYVWLTADVLDVEITKQKLIFEQDGVTDVKITKKKLKLSEEDCKAIMVW